MSVEVALGETSRSLSGRDLFEVNIANVPVAAAHATAAELQVPAPLVDER